MARMNLRVLVVLAAVAAGGIMLAAYAGAPAVHADHPARNGVALPHFVPEFDSITEYTRDSDYTSDLDEPESVAVNSEHVFVHDSYVFRIFDSAGNSVGSSDGGVEYLALSPTNVFTSDAFFVRVYDLAGNRLIDFPIHGEVGELVVGPAGNIFVVDTRDKRVEQYDVTGEFMSAFGEKGTGPGQFVVPHGLAFNGTHFFVTDSFRHNVQIFDADGAYAGTFGSLGDGPGQLNGPRGIAASTTHIFVADTNNNRIQVFDLAGNYAGEIASETPSGLALSTTHLFVAEPGNNQVRAIDLTGDYMEAAPPPAPPAGILSLSYGNGTMQVLDAGDLVGELGRTVDILANSTHLMVTDSISGRTFTFPLPGN